MNSKNRFLLAVASIVGFGLAISTQAVHGDLNIITWVGSYVSRGHLNVYQAIYDSPARSLADWLTYPPLTYLYFGALISAGKLFGLFAHVPWAVPQQLRGTEYMVIRLTYVPYLLLMAWTFRRFAERFVLADAGPHLRMARLSFLVVLASPVLVFVTFIFGQFDVLPSSLLFLGVYLLATGRLNWGVLAVFAGAWLKNFPILFLLCALPLLVAEFGWKRTVGALALGGIGTFLLVYPFRSPGFSATFLSFKHTDYDVLFSTSWGIRATASNLLLGCVVLLSLGLVFFQNRLQFWERLVLIYAGSLVSLLAGRYWMPQYIAWVVPVLLLFVLFALRHGSPLFAWLYLAFNAVYLVSGFVFFPENLDTVMFYRLRSAGVPSLGTVLHLSGRRSEVWTAMSMLLLLMGTYIVVRVLSGGWLSEKLKPSVVRSPERQLQLTLFGSLALVFLFVVAHMANAVVARL